MLPGTRRKIAQFLFLFIIIVAGGFTHIGVKQVFGESGFLYAVFAVATLYGSIYIAAKVSEDFEQKQMRKEEDWDKYWTAYWNRVHTLEDQIKEFPEDGRAYDLECIKKELRYMTGIKERYDATHK